MCFVSRFLFYWRAHFYVICCIDSCMFSGMNHYPNIEVAGKIYTKEVQLIYVLWLFKLPACYLCKIDESNISQSNSDFGLIHVSTRYRGILHRWHLIADGTFHFLPDLLADDMSCCWVAFFGLPAFPIKYPTRPKMCSHVGRLEHNIWMKKIRTVLLYLFISGCWKSVGIQKGWKPAWQPEQAFS